MQIRSSPWGCGDSDHASVSAQELQKASKSPEHPSPACATELDSHTAGQVELPWAQRWAGTKESPDPTADPGTANALIQSFHN